MKQWIQNNLVYLVTLVIWVAFFLYCAILAGITKENASKNKALSYKDQIENHIRHADTYFWFNLADGDSNDALSRGEKEIKKAKKKLKEASADSESGLSPEEIKDLENRLKSTKSDIHYQHERHIDEFHGVFAWSHFMAKASLFQDDRATGSYGLLREDPEVIACQDAVHNLTRKVLGAQTIVAQYDVVFVTDPDDFPGEDDSNDKLSKQLENEALYIFNLDPRFFVHNMLEVASTLKKDEQKELRELQPSHSTLSKLRNQWGNRDILIVRIKKLDLVDFHHFWSAQGRLFRHKDDESAQAAIAKTPNAIALPDEVYNNYGFCRDRRHMLAPVVFFNALMFISAIILFRFLSGVAAHDRKPAPWKAVIGLGAIGYIWGRVSVWGLVEIVERFAPPNETLAIVSFWWPAMTGIVILFGPGFIARFAESRFGWLSSEFGTYNRGGALFATISMGSLTYVAQAALWVRTWEGWSVLPPLIIATIFAAWIIGRALDQTEPVNRRWAIPMVLLGLLIGPAFSHSYPVTEHILGLWLTAIPICAVGMIALVRSGTMVRDSKARESEKKIESPIESVVGLVHRIQDPPFQSSKTFVSVAQTLREGSAGHHGPTAVWVDKSTVRIQIIGPAGIGKTALLKALQDTTRKRDRDAAFMVGTCPEPAEGSEPESFRPFADAIADYFAVNLLLPPKKQLIALDEAIDGIFDEVVPFSDLLFPPTKTEGTSGSKTELFNSIVIMIRHMAEKRRVVLIMDDAQWIDPASRELLDYLLDNFPPGDPSGVALIVSSREEVAGFYESEKVVVEKLTDEEITSLLQEGLMFESDAAMELAAAVSEEEGNMHWLFQMINYLAHKEVLDWKEKGFGWDSQTSLSDHVPDDLLESLQAMLESHPEFRRVLGCASCIGPKFTVEVLSQSLNESRLETIHLLDQIEKQTGIVRDMHHQDDTFEFRSSFILEVLRNLLQVNSHGPNKPSPQRIREFHARLANAWEGTLEQSPAALFRLATHRFAAGVRHANLALENTLTAAHAASAQFQHEQARKYLSMARECLAVSGIDSEDLETELLLIECREAHVEGRNREEMAELALAMLNDRPDSPFEVYAAAALACYDAGSDTRNQTHFANAVSIGEQIVDRFQTPLEQAEGHHFIGIGLPPAEGGRRRHHLETALQLLDQAGDGIQALKLRGRVTNSLGELLSHWETEDQKTARDLFMESIELKSKPQIRDIAGLAFAHGGLGRLAFYADEVDCETARIHFQEDLHYSERIGSLSGQTKMHSMLAACDLYEARLNKEKIHYQNALERYEIAYRLLEAQFDMFFALAGLVECHEGLDDQEKADEYGRTLVDLVKSRLKDLPEEDRHHNPIAAIPPQCIDNIRLALRECNSTPERAWHHWLNELIEHNRATD